MKTIHFAFALTASMAVLAGPASADTPPNWGCRGGSDDQAQLDKLAPHIVMRRVLQEYQTRWDAAYIREQCEAFVKGEPHEISCLRGRRDWDAIKAMVPEEIWAADRAQALPLLTELQAEDDGYKAAIDFCREAGAIPTKWVR